MMPALDAAVPLPWRTRLAVGGLLALVAGLGWAWTAYHAHMMHAMPIATPESPAPWGVAGAVMMFAMWTLMMAAMMVPSVGPMVTAFATINLRRRERSESHVPTAVFLAGYLLVWTAFSLAATALHWALNATGLLGATMASSSPAMSAVLFVLAGAYQFSPLKQTCLAWCRSPLGFVLSEWRDGAAGALVMGIRHGAFCTGCCAALMLLLFAVAVMDLRWVAALAVIVGIEKLAPNPTVLRRAIGGAAIAAGVGYAVVAIAR